MIFASQPFVSIITVNYNNVTATLELLASLKKISYKNFEIIVVDNASKSNPEEELIAAFPTVRVVRSESNLGFAGGNNLGIQQAKGELLFFVNNDTEFTYDLLEQMISTFQEYPDAGAVSPKFHYFFVPGTIEYAGYGKINKLTGRTKMVGHQEVDKGQYDQVSETNFAHGGGMMVPRYVIDKVGMMPEAFFLYYEELDWCSQIKRNGFKIYYQPKALIYHKESMTTGKDSVLKTFFLTRNRLLFMRRNASVMQLAIFILYLILVTIPKNLAVFLISRKPLHAKAFIQGILWNVRSDSRSLLYRPG